jgi:hypothetical protein
MINVKKEPVTPTKKKSLKEEILEEITEKLLQKILDMVNQNVQDALKKFQGTKSKEHKKTQKQINEEKTLTNTKGHYRKRFMN